jgi:hypothetical protein
MCDGTYYSCPKNFYHLFTIFGIIQNNPFPLVYCLLTNKSELLYLELFKNVFNWTNKEILKYVIGDFEIAIKNAIHSIKPNVLFFYCYFHFCQTLYRKIVQFGFKNEYKNDGEVNSFFKCMTALPFVPPGKVFEEFSKLKNHYKSILNLQIEKYFNYFEDNYLFGNLYNLESWNCRFRILNNLPLTNNALEGYHSGLKAIFTRPHPSLTHFVFELRENRAMFGNMGTDF